MSTVLLFFLPVIIIFTIIVLFVFGYHFLIYPLRTNKWRKNLRQGSLCRFYYLEEKHTGRIKSVDDDSVIIEYLGPSHQQSFIISLISNIYPIW